MARAILSVIIIICHHWHELLLFKLMFGVAEMVNDGKMSFLVNCAFKHDQ